MTIESPRLPAGAAAGPDADLIAGLWEEAPFPRLPRDAPPELRDLVEVVENPRRVYAIHCASRRHRFQLTVQKYIVQLREGCGVSTCCMPTCLTCRRRIAGHAPLRRYNTTSARTLAVHLASQDNPEAGLCPALRLPKTPPAAINSLVFVPKADGGASANASAYSRPPFNTPRNDSQPKDRIPLAKSRATAQPSTRRHDSKAEADSQARRPSTDRDRGSTSREKAHANAHAHDPIRTSRRRRSSSNGEDWAQPRFTIREKAMSKDYRSFAANMFGTVAFKMLEWLTPTAIANLTETAARVQDSTRPDGVKKALSIASSGVSTPEELSLSAPTESTVEGNDAALEGGGGGGGGGDGGAVDNDAEPKDAADSAGPPTADTAAAPSAQPLGHSAAAAAAAATAASSGAVRNASARVRTPTATKRPQHKLSMEPPFAPDADDRLPAGRSPLLPSVSADGVVHKTPATKPLKSSTPTLPLPLSQLSNTSYFDDGVSLEKMSPAKARRSQFDLSMRSGSDSSVPQSVTSSSRSLSLDRSSSGQSSVPPDGASGGGGGGGDGAAAADASGTEVIGAADAELDADLDGMLPQTLTRLTAEVIDFICDVLQDDYDREYHFLEPAVVARFHVPYDGQPRALKRRTDTDANTDANTDTDRLALEWRMFIDQSLFYVLSNPQALLQSFTHDGHLHDSQTLWYCMLRLTRVAPNLVLHSLWTAAEALFTPSRELLSQRLPGVGVSAPVPASVLTDVEAGRVMAICLHALVGVAPVVDDVRKLYDMSRLRAQGISLSGSASMSRASTMLCLQYDDAFSYDQALRLARRLFSAITARRFYAGMARAGEGEAAPVDVLGPLFEQLDFLNMDAAYVLNFTASARTMHETRVPTLLLDWARTVMLQDWTGSAVVPADGPFGGALALIAAIYERRHDLLVGDIQFRLEYFAERLEDLDMPIRWLSFAPTRKTRHLLDFPFLFSPASLVSYFRAINFSRMSQSFEDASSLQSRTNAIISPGSLVINPYHRAVLQDRLKTAAARYLILDVSRTTALQDSFDQLFRREARELLRPLKVHLGEYDGEEGFDSGGVQQEYFRLVLAEALDPRYGVFTVDERTHMAWFNPATLEEAWKYELIGLLVSLAVFNGISLPVTFPRALYRKLLGEPVNELHHIADGWPELASGLTALLEWNEQAGGAVEDVFVRTYEFSVDMFGTPVSRVMGGEGGHGWPSLREEILGEPEPERGPGPKPEPERGTGAKVSGKSANAGDPPMVTNENRSAYVTDYISYLTDVSVRPQFEAFARGFGRCLDAKSLRLLNAGLLQSLVEGQQEIVVDELKAHARYVGWDAQHPTVQAFWEIVGRYGERMKRKLLEFVTASDRLPVGGAKNVQFVVQRNGEEPSEGGHLPTAYTCYGILLLPEYASAAALEERLGMALENAQGFGFA